MVVVILRWGFPINPQTEASLIGVQGVALLLFMRHFSLAWILPLMMRVFLHFLSRGNWTFVRSCTLSSTFIRWGGLFIIHVEFESATHRAFIFYRGVNNAAHALFLWISGFSYKRGFTLITLLNEDPITEFFLINEIVIILPRPSFIGGIILVYDIALCFIAGEAEILCSVVILIRIIIKEIPAKMVMYRNAFS